MGTRTALVAVAAALAVAAASPATGRERPDDHRSAPPPNDRPYWESDTDDHPGDWQPTHDHRRVRHSIMADCSGSDLHEHVLCVWTPLSHPDVARYQIWHEDPQRPRHARHHDTGVLLAEVDAAGPTVYWHVDHPPMVGVSGYMIRAVDGRGRLLDHTMPFPYRRHSTASRRLPVRSDHGDAGRHHGGIGRGTLGSAGRS